MWQARSAKKDWPTSMRRTSSLRSEGEERQEIELRQLSRVHKDLGPVSRAFLLLLVPKFC